MRLNARTFESMAIWLMILGIVALCQPWSLFLHRYGLTVVIIGLVAFIVFSHIRSPAPERNELG